MALKEATKDPEPRVTYVRRDTFFLDTEPYFWEDGQEKYALTYEQALELNNALRQTLDMVT